MVRRFLQNLSFETFQVWSDFSKCKTDHGAIRTHSRLKGDLLLEDTPCRKKTISLHFHTWCCGPKTLKTVEVPAVTGVYLLGPSKEPRYFRSSVKKQLGQTSGSSHFPECRSVAAGPRALPSRSPGLVMPGGCWEH